MSAMLEIAVCYGILAWLGCWDVDLAVRLLPGPLTADLMLKFLIVTICLVIVLVAMARHGWLWSA
jgi:hypothetical protein